MVKTFQVSVPPANPKNFEEIFESLGGFGKFQVLVLTLLLFVEIPAAFVMIIPVFVGSKPDLNSWTCNGKYVNPADLCNCNGTLNSPPTTFVAEWSLICDSVWVSDFITSLQMLGMFVGNIYACQLSDWYGRRYTFLGTNLILLAGTIISAVSPNPYVYSFARFLCGAGFAGLLALTAGYSIEFLPAKWRHVGGSVGPFGEGTMLLAVIAYYVRPWRTLLWISAAPFVCLIIIFPLLPESPRWLLRNKKIKEAHKVIDYMARLNGTESIKIEVLQKIAQNEGGVVGSTDGGSENDKQAKVKRFSYLDFFRYKDIRLITICLMVIWSSWSISYFGLTYNIKNLPGSPYLNVIYLGLADSLGFPSFLLTGNNLGRRRSVVFFTTISSVFLVIIAVMFLTVDTDEYPGIILLFSMLAKYGTAGTRSATRCLTGESFPTSIRSMGTGLSGASASFIGFLAPQLVFLGAQWPWVPFLAFAIISVCGSLFSLLMKETSGEALTDEVIQRRISIDVGNYVNIQQQRVKMSEE